MMKPTHRAAWQRYALHGLNLLAIGIGLKAGYDFGFQIGGMPLGLWLAAITALFATLVVDVVSSYLDRTASHEAGESGEWSAPRR
jgi:hypothetical protein